MSDQKLIFKKNDKRQSIKKRLKVAKQLPSFLIKKIWDYYQPNRHNYLRLALVCKSWYDHMINLFEVSEYLPTGLGKVIFELSKKYNIDKSELDQLFQTYVSPSHGKVNNHPEYGDDGFEEYDFSRAEDSAEDYFLNYEGEISEDDKKLCCQKFHLENESSSKDFDHEYITNDKFRKYVARELFYNSIDSYTISSIQGLAEKGFLWNMDKESMVPFPTSSVMRYKVGLIVANQR